MSSKVGDAQSIIFSPFHRDLTIICLMVPLASGMLYVWPLNTLMVLSMLSAGIVLADGLNYYTFGKHLFPEIKLYFTQRASEELLLKAEKDTLTLLEAKWLLTPGIFRDKADFIGASSLEQPETVLHWVAHHGRVELTKYLMAQGASVSQVSFLKGTPFNVAVCQNRPALLRPLFYDEKQLTQKCGLVFPLEMAARQGHVETFLELVQLGAAKNRQHLFSALEQAIREGKVKILRAYYNVDVNMLSLKTENGNLIHVAAREGKLRCLQFLLSHAKPSQYSAKSKKNGLTPADLAYIRSHQDCSMLLRRKGARMSGKKLMKGKNTWRSLCTKFETMRKSLPKFDGKSTANATPVEDLPQQTRKLIS